MTDMRKCIGSAKFGIEAHEAPVNDFPIQPSQKDGLGRMCNPHWKQYVSALGRARTAAKAGGSPCQRPVPSRGAAGWRSARAREPETISIHRSTSRSGKVPAADGTVPSVETPAVKVRRQKLDATLAKVGVGSDEGQRVLEAVNGEALRARGRKTEAGEADVEETGIA